MAESKKRDGLKIGLIVVHSLFVLLLIANLVAQIFQTYAITAQNVLIRRSVFAAERAEEKCRQAGQPLPQESPSQ